MTHTIRRRDALTPGQKSLACILMRSALAECHKNDLALLAEGHLKVALANALLDAGCELREGAHETGRDWLFKRQGRTLITRKVDREARKLHGPGSRDLRVEGPRFQVELKCYGEFGAKDFMDRGDSGFSGDLERVQKKHAEVFLCAVAGKLYDDARGDAIHPGGRRGRLFPFLPCRTSLPLNKHKTLTVKYQKAEFFGSPDRSVGHECRGSGGQRPPSRSIPRLISA